MSSTAASLAALCLFVSSTAIAADTVDDEINSLLQRVPGIRVIELPAAGTVPLDVADSLTIDKLHNVVLDDDPPVVTHSVAYPPNLGDGAAQGAEPYIAAGIGPFRFRHFRLEWTYAGWHTWALSDYALLHGFKVGVLYNRQAAEVPVADSEFLYASPFSWNSWFAIHSMPNGEPYAPQRWDRLPPRADLVSQLLSENMFPARAGMAFAMLDLEDPTFPEEEAALRQKSWYPSGGVDPAFEDAYYNGFVDMELTAVETTKYQGWQEAGIYGWAPFPRRWFGLDTIVVDPNTYWPWTRYGREIYRSPAVDVIYPSVYNFYWESRNVAYVLASIDLNLRLVNSEPVRKQVRPYFWNQLHGGGAGWRWWRGQPVRNEDMRAMIAMTFFTGVDGLTLWNWSGSTNPHIVSPTSCTDYTVGTDFDAIAEASGAVRAMYRYDAIHILEVDAAGTVRFQVIDKAATRANSYGTDRPKTFSTASPEGYDHRCWQAGDPLSRPVYSMQSADLQPLLRPASESLQPLFEGLALARVVERTLSTGTAKTDVSSQEQLRTVAPIVRRVDNAGYSIIAVYDPQWETFPGGRTVALTGFDGRAGLTLEIPADKEVRLFLLRYD